MELLTSKLIEALILPPASFILLGIIGLSLSIYFKRLGYTLSTLSLLGLLTSSMPFFTAILMSLNQPYIALSEQDLQARPPAADAIVVLSAGKYTQAQEYAGESITYYGLERARYAAWLSRRTKLPLLVSGGLVFADGAPEAALMRDTLQNEFMVFVDYLETQSRTTFENAQYSAQILHSHGLTSIFLVTHAWHMPRAKQAFEHFGIKVIPAPTVFYGSPAPVSLGDFIPTTHALLVTSVAFHEIIGRIWYQVHYYQ